MPILALRVAEVRNHENADRLRVFRFEGTPDNELTQIIANTDNLYEVGDLVACALVGTILSDGTEIKKGKLRGELSFGMTLGKTNVPMGTDLTHAFNATNASKASDESTGVVADASWVHYTSIESYLKMREDILACDEVIVTEKAHGSNFRVGLFGSRGYVVGTHGSRVLPERMSSSSWPSGHLIHHALSWCEKYNLEGRVSSWHVKHPNVNQMAIYGELMGFKCSNLHYGETGQLVRLFGEAQINGRFLDYPEAIALIDELFPEGVTLIPVLYRGAPDHNLLKKLRDLPSSLAAANGVDQISEGIVIRPAREKFSSTSKDRLIAKWKGPLYSERKTLQNQDPDRLPVYLTVYDLLFDFITEERVKHVLQRAQSRGVSLDLRNINEVVEGLLEDILKESTNEWPEGEDPRSLDRRILIQWTKTLSLGMISEVLTATK